MMLPKRLLEEEGEEEKEGGVEVESSLATYSHDGVAGGRRGGEGGGGWQYLAQSCAHLRYPSSPTTVKLPL